MQLFSEKLEENGFKTYSNSKEFSFKNVSFLLNDSQIYYNSVVQSRIHIQSNEMHSTAKNTRMMVIHDGCRTFLGSFADQFFSPNYVPILRIYHCRK